MYFGDWTFIILIPAFILSLWAQYKTQSAFKNFSQVFSKQGFTADQIARNILNANGIGEIRVERIAGTLTDHYDPRDKVLRLSDEVYGKSSIAAIGVAAHEAGHAIQHAQGYFPIIVRNSIVPVVNITSNLAIPLFLIGIFFSIPVLLKVGILFFSGVVAFHLVTLPVELDASYRAIRILDNKAILAPDELKGAKSVLNAAAMTYIAAALMAILNLVRLLILSRNND